MKRQAQIAKVTGISAGYLSKILNGGVFASEANLEKILAAYGLSSLDELKKMFPRIQTEGKYKRSLVKVSATLVQGDVEMKHSDITSVIEHLRWIEEKSGIKIALTITT